MILTHMMEMLRSALALLLQAMLHIIADRRPRSSPERGGGTMQSMVEGSHRPRRTVAIPPGFSKMGRSPCPPARPRIAGDDALPRLASRARYNAALALSPRARLRAASFFPFFLRKSQSPVFTG